MVRSERENGEDSGHNPDTTTGLAEPAGHLHFLGLEAILLKACQPDLALRYAATAARLEDLQATAREV